MVAHQLRRRGRNWTVLVGSVAVVVALGACRGGDGDGIANPTTTTLAAEPTTSTASTSTTAEEMSGDEAAARAGYESASRAFIEAAAIPDPNYPALVATHTGPMLEQRREVLLALKAEGRAIRYPPNSQYRVEVDSVELNGDVAILEVCGVDDGQRVVVATGEVVSAGVVTVSARAAMRRVEGTWLLAERTKKAEWQGVAGCAAD